jgi:thiamine pyrophosphate-dependent acetolactate synthase large subunit-like protein
VTESTRHELLARLRGRGPIPGHAIVARALAANGITHVYGVSGRPIDATLASCMRDGLRVIGARHQQGATLMSAAHNYVAGALRSAVIVSAGPAVTNTATGLLVAHDNRWPLLVIGGRHGLSVGGDHSFQAFDGARFAMPFTKHAALVRETEALAHSVSEACRVAMCGAPGPTYLDIGAETLAGQSHWLGAQVEGGGPSVIPRAAPAAAIRDAACVLAAARRPVLLIGKGLRWCGEPGWLRRLVDEHSIPFAASPMGRGFLPDDHPLCVSAVRGPALSDADLVLMVGGRFNWTFHYGIEVSPRAQVVRIDIDPDESAQVLGRGIGLQGDAAATVEGLFEALAAMGSATTSDRRDREWIARLKSLRAAAEETNRKRCEGLDHPMSPFQWMREVRECLSPTALTVLDGNVVMSAAQHSLPVLAPFSRLTPGTNGCMGVGIPFAIGAKLARPDLPVVAICGDFSFGLSAIELETAVRCRVPVSIVVANNGGPGGATRQREFYPPPLDGSVARFTEGIRHDLIMAALGGRGTRVQRPGELSLALREALACEAPTCIDVLTNEETPLAPVI